MDVFVSTISVCLNYLDGDITEFGVLEFFWNCHNSPFLVSWLGSNLPCLLFLIFDLARSCRASFRFYSILSFVFVSCGRMAISFLLFVSRGRRSVYFLLLFLADAVPFLFFFFCLIRLVGT